MTVKEDGILVSTRLVGFYKYDKACMHMIALLAKMKGTHTSSVITNCTDYKVYHEYGVSPKLWRKIYDRARLRGFVKKEGENGIRVGKIKEDNGYNIKVYVKGRTIKDIEDQLYMGIGEKFLHDAEKKSQDSVIADGKRRRVERGVRLAVSDRVLDESFSSEGVLVTNDKLAKVLGLGLTKAKAIKKRMLASGLITDIAGFREMMAYTEEMGNAIEMGMVEEYAEYIKEKLHACVFAYAPHPFERDARLYLQKCSRLLTSKNNSIIVYKYAA